MGKYTEDAKELLRLVGGKSMAAGVVASAERSKKDNGKELKAFLTGKVIELKEVDDGVFSEGMMDGRRNCDRS